MAKRKKRKTRKRRGVSCKRERFKGGTRTVCRDAKGRIRRKPRTKKRKATKRRKRRR